MNPIDLLVYTVIGSFTLTAYVLVAGTLFTAEANKAAQFVRTSFWKSFFLGLVNFPFFAIIAILLFRLAQNEMSGIPAGIVALIALTIVACLFTFTSIGLSGFNMWFRERLGLEISLSNTLRSAFLLAIASLAPYVGWFLLTPFVLAISLGAAIQAMLRRKTATTTS